MSLEENWEENGIERRRKTRKIGRRGEGEEKKKRTKGVGGGGGGGGLKKGDLVRFPKERRERKWVRS